MLKIYAKAALVILSAATLTLSSVSCQKDSLPEDNIGSDKVVSLKVNVLGDISTKATLNEAGESAVNKLEVFVFNSDGTETLDVYGCTSGESSLTLSCTTGKKKIYALVNGDLSEAVLKTIDTKSKLLAATTSLENNTTSSFVMLGSTTETVTADTQVSLTVERFVSRIGIGSIKTNFASAAYKNMTFIVKKIYVINAVGQTNLSQTSVPEEASFINFKRGIGNCDALLSYKTEHTLTNGVATDINQYFYTYANPTKVDCQDDSSNARFTRLVIEATLGGTTYYYPISIVGADGTLQSNKSYMITSLTITRPGSSSPDEPFELASSAVSLEVKAWDESTSNNTI